MSSEQVLGIYKATVKRNNDPLGARRIVVFVPQVLGMAESEWAQPIHTTGTLPAINDAVWVQFSGGDVAKPVYH